MTTDELLDIANEHLQEVNDDKEERLNRIKTLLDFFNYNLRLTELSNEEKQDFFYCNEGYPLSDKLRKTLDNCKTEEKKDYYISMWARSTYFRKCAWLKYLLGETNDKPSMSMQTKATEEA